MTIEHSHGKARPTLPRASDLPDLHGTVAERPADRDATGRVGVGNKLALGRGWKRAIKRLAGAGDLADPVAATITADALRIMSATLAEMPHDGANVRALVANLARHEALAAYFARRAFELGLETTEGEAADQRATTHDQRAERLRVTAFDIAARLAKRKPAMSAVDYIIAGGAS